MSPWISNPSAPLSASDHTLLKHLPLVRFLAQRIHRRLPQHIDVEDLCSAGILGLIDAFSKFDSAQDIKFATFASFRIRGAILDSLRRLDWAPRTLRRKDKSIQKTIHCLTSRFGHAPTEEQVVSALDTTLDAYQKVLADLEGLHIGSLYRFSNNSNREAEPVAVRCPQQDDPLFRCIQSEAKERVTRAIRNLSSQHRQVVTLYYYEELSSREIAQVMGIDSRRATHLRVSALAQLRAAFSLPSKRARAKAGLRVLSRRKAVPVHLEPRAAA
jgi:RNA polymerase sigma factor for flagellar operon FliA